MFYQKTGFPEEGELVLCKVTTVQYNSVFVQLMEYDRQQGMIHISEISPGRIRNIHDYVKEGKVVVCKVLRINRERHHIDLSLRRVSDYQRREKVNGIKQEQMAEKILEFIGKKYKKDAKAIYDEVMLSIQEEFDQLYPFFEEVVEDESAFDLLKMDATIKKDLLDVIKQRIKPPEVRIAGTVSLQSFAYDGVEVVKETLEVIKKAGGDALSIFYAGAGHFNFVIISPDYKIAESILAAIKEKAESFMEKKEGIIIITRKER
ncbi:MAG: S1 RNA-binding domain-containing protein [DPANN group archaeon]|nr:S1 RNA-binding domain-containing protein [DPANN group archaeon]